MSRRELLFLASRKWGHYKVSGKSFKYNQLLEINKITSTSTLYGITITNNGDGSITLNGTSTSTSTVFPQLTSNISFIANHHYLTTGNNLSILPLGGGWTRKYGTNDMINIPNENKNQSLGINLTAGKTYNNDKVFLQIIDLTELFGVGNEPTTLEQFYATDLGKAIQNGAYLPYSATNAIYNATSPLSFYKETTAVRTFAPTTPLVLSGIGTAKDYWLNYNGKVNRVIGNYTFTGNETWVQNATDTTGIYKYHFAKTGLKALSGGSAIPNILCDGLETKSNNQMYSRINGVGQNTLGTEIVVFNSGVQSVNAMKTFMQGKTIYYELATPTTETINSLMLPKGITKVTDANGVELEIE